MPGVSILMVGAGEYNVGYVPTAAGAAPDKRCGVTAIVLFDLRRRGLLDRILLADADGRRLPLARACMSEKIGAYAGMDTSVECWPKDETVAFDPLAPEAAMDSMAPGDGVVIFTPDPTHFAIAMAAIKRGLHVLVAKPIVKVLSEHLALEAAAAAAGVVCAVEYHKRWDPIYNDARERARALGDFSFFTSMMTQRKAQLDTFAAWAGKSSDISYYLNSHHIDILAWMLAGRAIPETVTAAASTGVAQAQLGRAGVEDTITLLVTWRNASGTAGHSVFTSSWVAPTADCHTQQNFHFMGHGGEIRADQAHRGYSVSADAASGGTGGLAAVNPLYMRYVPDAGGRFAGQTGYGYRSIEAFVDACSAMRAPGASVQEVSATLASVAATLQVTAILEAGRRSLDAGGRPVKILYKSSGSAAAEGGVDVLAKPCGFE